MRFIDEGVDVVFKRTRDNNVYFVHLNEDVVKGWIKNHPLVFNNDQILPKFQALKLKLSYPKKNTAMDFLDSITGYALYRYPKNVTCISDEGLAEALRRVPLECPNLHRIMSRAVSSDSMCTIYKKQLDNYLGLLRESAKEVFSIKENTNE